MGNKAFNAILAFIIVIALCGLAFWITVGVITFRSIGEIEQHGLKAVIERIWCGPSQKGCTLPTVQ